MNWLCRSGWTASRLALDRIQEQGFWNFGCATRLGAGGGFKVLLGERSDPCTPGCQRQKRVRENDLGAGLGQTHHVCVGWGLFVAGCWLLLEWVASVACIHISQHKPCFQHV